MVDYTKLLGLGEDKKTALEKLLAGQGEQKRMSFDPALALARKEEEDIPRFTPAEDRETFPFEQFDEEDRLSPGKIARDRLINERFALDPEETEDFTATRDIEERDRQKRLFDIKKQLISDQYFSEKDIETPTLSPYQPGFRGDEQEDLSPLKRMLAGEGLEDQEEMFTRGMPADIEERDGVSRRFASIQKLRTGKGGGPGKDTGVETDLEEAKRKDRLINLISGLQRASAQVGRGLVGAGGIKMTPFADLPKVLESKEAEKLLKKKYTDAQIKKLKNAAKGGMSAYQKARLEIMRDSFGLREKAEERRGKQFNFKMDDTDRQRRTKIMNTYNKDDVIEAGVDTKNKLKNISSFINNDSPLAMGFVTRALARISGEVGVMTDKDVAAFRVRSLPADLQKMHRRALDGKLSAIDKKAMLDAAIALEKLSIEKMRERTDFLSKQVVNATGMDYDDVHTIMAPKTKTNDVAKRNGHKKDKVSVKQAGVEQAPRVEKTGKVVLQKQYSPLKDKTKITYSDGTTEVVDGKR